MLAPAETRAVSFRKVRRSWADRRVAALVALMATLAVPSAARAAGDWYVAIGDSYSRGSQPGHATGDEGFVYQLRSMARSRGYDLRVANFACGGATTSSLLTRPGCDGRKTRVEGDQPYEGETQIAAARRFIAANRGRVGLVTVSIGLNDIGRCVRSTAPPGCLDAATEVIRANVAVAAGALREAAGPGVPVVGVGYPNVYLGAWLRPGKGRGHARAREMRAAFMADVNPALRAGYRAGEAAFADVTKASGGYRSLHGTRLATSQGPAPMPVARICQISWFCSNADIHLNRAGYRLVARTVLAGLPAHPAAGTVASGRFSR